VQGDDYLDELLREMRQDAINEEYAVNVAKGNIEEASADNAGKSPKKEIKKTASQPLQKKSSKLDDQTNAIYQRLLDPDTLLDYNPQDGGMRIGLAGLAGLPLGDNAVYSVRAQIGRNFFKWNCSPGLSKSYDGVYMLDDLL